MPSETELDIHNVLSDNRLKATGKLEAIADILYGPDGEYLDDFEEDGEGEEESEEEGQD